ncbi:MAG: hypothetical protein L0Y43_02355 [Methylococcaceae bacterium]|nr:hypothetical protein [Methylococcaceae bacterium]
MQFHRDAERIEDFALAAPLFRHPGADVLPEIAELRHFAAGHIVGDRNARELHDAAFDRIHQREIAHRPREQRAFGITRTAQEKRRRREVDHARDPELAFDDFQAGNPETGGFVVFPGFLFVFNAFESQAHEFRVGVVAGIGQMIQKLRTGFAKFWRDFREPDCRFDRFDLAEKGSDAVEAMVPPMLQQTRRFRAYEPIGGTGYPAPGIHLAAQFVDDWSWIILHGCGGKTRIVVGG